MHSPQERAKEGIRQSSSMLRFRPWLRRTQRAQLSGQEGNDSRVRQTQQRRKGERGAKGRRMTRGSWMIVMKKGSRGCRRSSPLAPYSTLSDTAPQGGMGYANRLHSRSSSTQRLPFATQPSHTPSHYGRSSKAEAIKLLRFPPLCPILCNPQPPPFPFSSRMRSEGDCAPSPSPGCLCNIHGEQRALHRRGTPTVSAPQQALQSQQHGFPW